MIDLHSHILPGVDDGARDVETSLEMARMAVADGIRVMACTPHFMPGLYDNTAPDIFARVQRLQADLDGAAIPLFLVTGCDAHIRVDFLEGLRNNQILRLNDSRYVLFEPPHNIVPQRMEDLLFNLVTSGFVPILTHPERLKWIESNFALIESLFNQGVWMQITAGSLTGRFGKRPKYWADRMLAEGMVHILATDAHNTRSRPPLLSEARQVAAAALGLDEAENLVLRRPALVLDNEPAAKAPPPLKATVAKPFGSVFTRMFQWGKAR
ncbi:MAG: capsular biosynthesis protein [Alphaproteobacteria bacterium]|nr:capsular biosynthesis protein [Alphaproteobacteria bacterium]